MGQSMGFFFFFFFSGKISPENACNDILQRKNAFLDYKNKNLIKSRNKHSFKRVGPCFWSKISNFAIFIFLGKQARNMRFTNFRKEERLFRLQKQKVKKDGKLGFFRRGQSMVFVKNLKSSIFLFQTKQARIILFTIY